jgi:L-ascorbate metabolism protein UlaG (beta-lactamase superfamily)
MQINWYGEGCFKLVENGTTITVDPVESFTGLTAPRFKTDVVIKTLMTPISPEDEKPIAGNDEDANMGGSDAVVIAGPGEYEVKGIQITGWPLVKSSTADVLRSIFKIKTDDISVGLLGHLSAFNDPEILEELGDVDILIIPGGGEPYIKQSDAAKLIRQIEPRMVIPSFFKVPGLKRKSEDASEFLKELGMKAEPLDKISIKHKELGEKLQVVLLTL